MVELREVQGKEEFEIINFADCLSADEGSDDLHPSTVQMEPLDLSIKERNQGQCQREARHTSVESLDSGCDIDTPRLSDKQGDKNFYQLENGGVKLETKIMSSDLKNDHVIENGINIVCTVQVIGEGEENLQAHGPAVSLSRTYSAGQVIHPKDSEKLLRKSSIEPGLPSINNEGVTEGEAGPGDVVPSFNEIFRLFEPRKSLNSAETAMYAQQLREKLANKMAATDRTKGNHQPSPPTKPEDVKPTKKLIIRAECPDYDDPELENFLRKCFESTYQINDKLIEKDESILISCFIPKERSCSEMLDYQFGSPVSEMSDQPDSNLSWSDGELVELTD